MTVNNNFWVLLVFVLLCFLFFKIVLCVELVNFSHDKKKFVYVKEPSIVAETPFS